MDGHGLPHRGAGVFLKHQACVAGGDEAAADKHAVAVAHAQLVLGIDHIDGGLNRVRQVRFLDHTVTTEHVHGNLLELVGRHHTLAPRVLGDHHGAQDRLQNTQIFLDLLVAHHGDHTDQLLEVVAFLDGLAQGFGGIHVVSAIQNDGR